MPSQPLVSQKPPGVPEAMQSPMDIHNEQRNTISWYPVGLGAVQILCLLRQSIEWRRRGTRIHGDSRVGSVPTVDTIMLPLELHDESVQNPVQQATIQQYRNVSSKRAST